MKSNATGQLFGYSLQFPRALLRLLESDIGANVGIEVCGDVAVFFPNGLIISEEDKSSLKGNALTDRSINLWKTFYNWIIAINAGELNADRDHFVLYTNFLITENSLASLFHKATDNTAENITQKSREVLKDIKQGHELFEYKEVLLSQNINIFKKVLAKFELIADHRADDVYHSIRSELEKMAIAKKEVEWVLKTLTGWLQITIMEKIAKHEKAIVSKESLFKELRPLLGKINRRELIDFAISNMPAQEELSRQANQRPIYVRQLEHIQLSDDEIMEAVSDYFRADTNRLDWIEQEIVNEADMDDFEGKLFSFHRSKQKTIELTESDLSEEYRGKLLLNECHMRQETIAGKQPPDRTIQGSYHVLADEKSLGWHPRWKELLEPKLKGEKDGKTH